MKTYILVLATLISLMMACEGPTTIHRATDQPVQIVPATHRVWGFGTEAEPFTVVSSDTEIFGNFGLGRIVVQTRDGHRFSALMQESCMLHIGQEVKPQIVLYRFSDYGDIVRLVWVSEKQCL